MKHTITIKPVMRFKVKEVREYGENIVATDAIGANILSINKNHPKAKEIKPGVILEVYLDELKIIKDNNSEQ
jgi:hypothetical protein